MFNIIYINYLAVLVSAIITMAIGFIWYSPVLFGKQWLALSGIKEEDTKKTKMSVAILTGFVAAWVMAYVLAYISYYFDASTIMEGINTGFWVWLGFVATVLINSVLYEGKPLKLYVLNAGYYFFALTITGAILAVWQ